jgi:hypothetical protein
VAEARDPLDDPFLPARTAQGTQAAVTAMSRAQYFAGLVRDSGPCAIGDYLDALSTDELYALTTTLAALVPIDTTPAELLGWLEGERDAAA